MVSARHRAARRGRHGAERDPRWRVGRFHLAAQALVRYWVGPRAAGGRAAVRGRRSAAGIRRRSCCSRTGPTAACVDFATRARARCWWRSSTSAGGGRCERGLSGIARPGLRPALTLRQRRAMRVRSSAAGDLARVRRTAAACRASAQRRVSAVRAPIAFVYGNCVFAQGLDDGWAAFAVEPSSYAWLSEEGKRARFLALIGALEAIEADMQILRVHRRWELERYARELREDGDTGPACARAHAGARERYIQEHVRSLGDVGAAQPAVFLLVSLREPERDVASYVSRAVGQHPREWWEAFSAGAGAARPAHPEGVGARARAGARRPGARAAGGLPAGAPGARRRAAVARAQGVLPRARGTGRSTVCTSRARWCSSATARRCSRRWRAT